MQNQPAISVFVRLEYWDIYRSNFALMVRQFRRVLLSSGVIGAGILALFVFNRSHPMPENNWFEMAPDIWSLLWVWGLPGFVLFLSPLLAARRSLKDERVKKGINYRFSDAGIHIESSVAISDVQWTAFRYLIATRSLFLLLTNRTAAGVQILPIRCFASGSDLAAMRQLLNNKIPNVKLRLY
jgi:hypothetical protein